MVNIMTQFSLKHVGPLLSILILFSIGLTACGTPTNELSVRNMANSTVVPGSVDELTPTDFVLAWLLYGTPTATPTNFGATPQPVAIRPTRTPIPPTATFALPAPATPAKGTAGPAPRAA